MRKLRFLKHIGIGMYLYILYSIFSSLKNISYILSVRPFQIKGK